MSERKRPGPKPRYRENRQEIHISLSVDLLKRIDAAAPEGRPAFIERVMRQHFGMPTSSEQKQEG